MGRHGLHADVAHAQMLAQRGIAQFPQAFVPNVDFFEVIRIITEKCRQTVQDRQPVFFVALQKGLFRVGKVLIRGMP
ncbi:MAG: hypothetical protein Q3X77_09305 [Oscillospiraceae bacterium]|nr:hypothetical protein [Oscillospiraceae bacterium]